MQWQSRQIFSCLIMLAILWSSLKQVNNYYHSCKVSNYCKSFHKENVLAINASRLFCRRRGAIKMLIELDLNVRWAQKWLWGPAQSLMKLLKIMALLSIRPRGFEQDNHFSRKNVKLFCVINPIHVNISRPIKNLNLSSGNVCRLEH